MSIQMSHRTKSLVAVIVAALVTLSLALISTDQVRSDSTPPLSPPAKQAIKAALQYFLELDHLDVTSKTLAQKQVVVSHALNEVLKYKIELEPLLIDVLQNGPSQQTRSYLENVFKEEWDTHQAFVKDEKIFIRGAGAKKLLKQQDRSEYVDVRVAQVVQKYRENSALGLAAIGTPTAVQMLNETLKKAPPDLRKVILDAARKYKHQLDGSQSSSVKPPSDGGHSPPAPPANLGIQ